MPATIKSFGNQLYLRFETDVNEVGKGFQIEWDGTSTGCGGVLTTSKGSISSPSYPMPYGHNAQCEWIISVNEGLTIDIVFVEVKLEE